MNEYCKYGLNEENGSCYLEFCIGIKDVWSKFENQNSLFVSDNAFLILGIDRIFCKVLPQFDFCCDSIIITKEQWSEIYSLSLSLDCESKQIFNEINTWVTKTLINHDCFTVIGV